MLDRELLKPGPRHEALHALVGSWDVRMTTEGPEGAQRSAAPLLAVKSLVGDGRYVLEQIEGEFAGSPHRKFTLLGFNNTRERYEYATADNHDAVLLLYATRPGATGDAERMDLYADYVSPGDAAPRGVLLTVRTRIEVFCPDEHRLTNFYAEPARTERKFLEYRYTRRAS